LWLDVSFAVAFVARGPAADPWGDGRSLAPSSQEDFEIEIAGTVGSTLAICTLLTPSR